MATKLGGTLSGAASGASAGAALGPYGALAGGVLGAGLGFFGSSDENSDAQKAAEQAAFDLITRMDAPPKLAREILLRQFEQAGVLTPEVEQKIKEIDPVQIKETAQNRQMQLEVANKYKSLSETGMSPEEYANINKLMNQAAQSQQMGQASILQRAQMEGRSGAGADIAAQLLSSQAGANREQQGMLDIGAQANARALEALAGYGRQAGVIREQDYRTEAKNTDVQNEFNRFSTTNQIEKEKRRVANENKAREYNTTRQQGVSDANVEQANAESQRQRKAEGTDYENLRRYTYDQAGAYDRRAGQYGKAQEKSDAELKGTFDTLTKIGGGLKEGKDAGWFESEPEDLSQKSVYEGGTAQGKGPLAPKKKKFLGIF